MINVDSRNISVFNSNESLVIESTDKSLHLSAGYHDISPFSSYCSYICFSGIKSNFDISKGLHQPAQVFVLDLETGVVRYICSTWAYCWEQGVRHNWLSDDLIAVNVLSQKYAEPKVVIYSAKTGRINSVIDGLFFHSHGKINSSNNVVSMDYSSVYNLWPSYGFEHKTSLYQPSNSIVIWDFATKNIITKINLFDLKTYKDRNKGFLIHPFISPDGSKILFMHRFIENKVLISWLYLHDIDTNTTNIIANEKISHMCWIDSDRFIIYKRIIPVFLISLFRRIRSLSNFFQSKNNFLFDSETIISHNSRRKDSKFYIIKDLIKKFFSMTSGFCIYTINNNDIYDLRCKLVGFNIIGTDCHPYANHMNNSILMDSYPDKNHKINLYSIDYSNPYLAKLVYSEESEPSLLNGKVDAHVRGNCYNNWICIDFVEKNIRKLKILKSVS